MYKELKKFAKHTYIYIIGSVLTRSVAIFLIPLYTRYFLPEEYGIISLILLIGGFAATFLSLGISSSLIRFYFDYKKEKDKKQVISTSQILILIVGFFGILILISLSKLFSSALFETTKYAYLFSWFFLAVFFEINREMAYTYIRIKEKSKLFVYLSVIFTLIALILSLYFILYLKMGIESIVYSSLIPGAIYFAFLTPLIFKKTGFFFSLEKAKKIIRFGFPLIPAAFLLTILFAMDRFFINKYLGLAAVGIYAVAFKFRQLLNYTILVPFTNIWSVLSYKFIKQKQGKELVSKLFTYLILLTVSISLIISIFIKPILGFFVGQEYFNAYHFVPILLLSFCFFVMTRVFEFPVFYSKKTKIIPIIRTITLLSSFVLFLILTPLFGLMGVAITVALSTFLLAFFYYLFSRKIIKIKYEFKRLSLIFALSIGLYLLANKFTFSNIITEIIIKLFVFGLFPLLLYLFRFFELREINKIKEILKNYFNKSR